jgi:hypothetical protein
MTKPSVFIGSSSEAIDVAYAVAGKLSPDAEVTVWNDGVFKPGLSFLESLVNALDQFDFAILVMTPDDAVTVRDERVFQPRGNLMFELGLFMGRLGRSRTFVLCPGVAELKLPSDLAGVTYLTYDASRADGNLTAAVRDACTTIRNALRNLGLSETRGIQRLTESTENIQNQVHSAVKVLVRSRIWETEIFRKHFGFALNKDEVAELDWDLAELRQSLDGNGA